MWVPIYYILEQWQLQRGCFRRNSKYWIFVNRLKEDADFSYAEKIVQLLTKKVLLEGLKKGTCLNVNIPNVNESQIKGIKVCKQGKAYWEDTFEKRKDPLGKDYYWLTGSFTSQDKDEETDVNNLKNNYVTVVPSQYDMTCLESVNKLKKWKLWKQTNGIPKLIM